MNKISKYLCIMILLSFTITGCVKVNKIENLDNEDKVQKIDFSENYTVVGAISNSKYIVSNSLSKKELLIYDLKSNEYKSLVSVYSEENFFDTIKYKGDWIVWVEHEQEIKDVQNYPYKWQIIAFNLKSHNKVIVDKSNFTEKPNSLEKFSTVPLNIEIDSDNLIYTKPNMKDGSPNLELVLQNLQSNSSTIIESITNLPEENIGTISISAGKIVWNEVSNLVTGRMPKYNFSYEGYHIYIYDIATNTRSEIEIKDNNYYMSPAINKDKVALVKLFENQPFYSEIVIYDLKTNSMNTVIDKNSTIYKEGNSNNIKGNIIMNDNYLTWCEDASGNRFIYNFRNNEYKQIIKENYSKEVNLYSNPLGLWDDTVYFKGVYNKEKFNSVYILSNL